MSKAADTSLRESRIVFMMSPAELAALDTWRHGEMIATRSEAIRRLVAAGIARSETLQQLRERLGAMEPEAAARAACGHPLVAGIDLQPTVTIRFRDGSDLRFVPGDAE